MAIPEFPRELFFGALHKLLELDNAWIKPGVGNSLYIRPFAIATQVGVSASPSDAYKFMIILSPAQAYYSGAVKVVIAENFSRAADGGVGFAKAAGNYGAQFYTYQSGEGKRIPAGNLDGCQRTQIPGRGGYYECLLPNQ